MTTKGAFFYPSKSPNTSSASPSDKVNSQIMKSEKKNNAIINLTEGRVSNIKLEEFKNKEKNIDPYYIMSGKKTNGRTLNVPKSMPAGRIPGHSYNGAVTIGAPCKGPHCSVPVPPTAAYMTNVNLRSANPPPGALTQFASTHRLGNNSDLNVGIGKYVNGTAQNPGPFNIDVQGNKESYRYIINPETGRKVPASSREGQFILENYINFN